MLRRVVLRRRCSCCGEGEGQSVVVDHNLQRGQRDVLVAVHEGDIVIRINPLIPRLDQIETIARARERGRIECEFPLVNDLGTILHHKRPDDAPRLIQPLLHIVGLVPRRRAHGPLGARLEQVRLVAQLPGRELRTIPVRRGERLADQRDRADQRVVSGAAVLAQVEAVEVADVGPCRVAVEVRGADRDGRRIVSRAVRVERPYELLFLRCVEGRVVSVVLVLRSVL